MPWWLNIVSLAGGASVALFFIWRKSVAERATDKAKHAQALVELELGNEREATAALRQDLARSGSVIAYQRASIERLEEDLHAVEASVPGAIRDRWRRMLQAAKAPGDPEPSAGA